MNNYWLDKKKKPSWDTVFEFDFNGSCEYKGTRLRGTSCNSIVVDDVDCWDMDYMVRDLLLGDSKEG